MTGYNKFLKERKEKNLYRFLRPASFKSQGKICYGNREYLDFSSNDYLGLADHPKMKEASKRAIDELGCGASASRLLSGDLNIHHILEEKTALFKGKEAALVFNSGYQANVGIINSLCSDNYVIFSDKLSHASLIDGILLSGAKHFRFRHNVMNHLETLLKKERNKYKNGLIITETVFSMDGDLAPLREIVDLKDRYGCAIMIDEAHATGIFGKNGSGAAEAEGLTGRIDLTMGTFSKALGSFGAYLACSGLIKEYLVNTCRSFIYSTALPPAVIMANVTALDLIKEEPRRRKTLLENAEYFRCEIRKNGFEVSGESQIVPLIVGGNEKAVKYAAELQDKGFWVLPVRSPTVPEGEARLRFSLSAHHKKDQLLELAEKIKEVIPV